MSREEKRRERPGHGRGNPSVPLPRCFLPRPPGFRQRLCFAFRSLGGKGWSRIGRPDGRSANRLRAVLTGKRQASPKRRSSELPAARAAAARADAAAARRPPDRATARAAASREPPRGAEMVKPHPRGTAESAAAVHGRTGRAGGHRGCRAGPRVTGAARASATIPARENPPRENDRGEEPREREGPESTERLREKSPRDHYGHEHRGIAARTNIAGTGWIEAERPRSPTSRWNYRPRLAGLTREARPRHEAGGRVALVSPRDAGLRSWSRAEPREAGVRRAKFGSGTVRAGAVDSRSATVGRGRRGRARGAALHRRRPARSRALRLAGSRCALHARWAGLREEPASRLRLGAAELPESDLDGLTRSPGWRARCAKPSGRHGSCWSRYRGSTARRRYLSTGRKSGCCRPCCRIAASRCLVRRRIAGVRTHSPRLSLLAALGALTPARRPAVLAVEPRIPARPVWSSRSTCFPAAGGSNR